MKAQYPSSWRPLSVVSELLILLICATLTRADCECGYTISDGLTTDVFTDLLETDFVHINYTIQSASNPWAPQAYNISNSSARGEFGESFAVANLQNDVLQNTHDWSSKAHNGNDAGLDLIVKSEVVDNMVQTAELATKSGEFFYGSYRAGMKISAVSGTCSAFFWYFNNTQEIDIEFLSADFNPSNNSYPVNLVLQTEASRQANYDASKTGTFTKAHLPFDPTAAYHEYRFDWLPGRVQFYADGALLASMNASAGGVPAAPGNVMLSHWSNGNPGWSRGPPATDALTSVSYVKAYYNSSSAARARDFAARCADPTRRGAVCDVPSRNATFFFMYQNNMTINQSTFGLDSTSSSSGVAGAGDRFCAPAVLAVTLAAVLWVSGL